MHVREVALDRDMRSRRVLPARTAVRSIHFYRRTMSVLTLVGIDTGAFVLCLLAASRVGHGALSQPWPGLTWLGAGVSLAVIVTVAALSGLYGRMHGRHQTHRVFQAWGLAFVVSSLLLLATETDGLGARFVAVWLMATALSFAGRWAFDAVLILRFGHGSDLPRAVLIGNAAEYREALETLAALPARQRLNVVGLVDLAAVEADPAATTQSPPSVPRYAGLEQALHDAQASEVVIADPQAVNGHLRGIMDECRRNGVALKAVVTSLALSHERVGYVPGLDCPLFLVQPRPTGGGSYVVKRVGDRLAAGLLLVVLSPLLAAIAITIRLTSPGPALFSDRRVGICQGPFTCYKFRTMVDDARRLQDGLEDRNEAQGALFKIREDPRVTSIGRVLRRYSLDELPQLLNVLKGDMSLVGPRPLPLRDGELMEEWHRQRHVVLPGMTGLWQIGGRSDIGFDEMLELDLRYIETWSLRGDLQIIWRTLGVVLGARGAY